MSSDIIRQVRRFNRAVTKRTGALDASYLGRGRPLGEARILFETGPAGADVKTLRDRLGLDSGYLARMLKSLVRHGLAMADVDPADRRRRRVSLTAKGRAEWEAYDALSDALARSMLAPLGPRQRERLVAAMAEVEALLTAGTVAIAAEPPDSEDARFCLQSYFAELAARFEDGFDPEAGATSPDTAMAPPAGAFLVARLDGRPVGCGGIKALDRETGEIKRMWVAPDMRGLGLSRRLLAALEDEARRLGFLAVRLDTNRTLSEARALYAKAGYREIARYNDNPYADHFFEKALS